MKKNLLLGSIVLLLCTLCIPFNSFAQFEKISIFRDLGTDTPTIQKPAQQNAVAINGPKATFTFSGGDGTTGNPYQISTAKDLVDLASAVNSLSKNSNGLSYASANYIMTDNIDMGEMVEGPFIICTQVIQSSNSSTKNQFILKASQNADGSYTCDPVALDNQTSSTNTHPITLANKTSTITNTKTGASGQYPPSGYTATFTYEFQGDKPLSISALSSPIGFLGVDSRNYVDNKISIPFKGTFDGNGYTISNFTMISENIATGLFGYIEGTIQNLAMTNVSIENPNSDYSGAIVGVAGGNVNSNPHTYSYIINCMVTNSNINGYYAGGIAGVLVNLDDIDQSYIQNCRAYNNDIVGSIGAPILGSGPHGNQHVEDNTAYNNNIAANYSGAIIGGTSTAKDVYDSNQNVDLGSPSSSINDFINGLLAGKIPDFCYINSGFMFDQNNIIDARILATLKNELDGTEPITQNLVLPNISAFTAAINNPQIIYANTITWSIYPPANTTTGGNGNDYWSVTAQIANGNIYTMNNNNQFSQYTGNLTYIPARKNNSPIKYYYKININGTDKYYPYYYTEQRYGNNYYISNPKFATYSTSIYYDYIYFGWNNYPQQLKNDLIQKLTTVNNAITSQNMQQYYKLTAPGTQANPVVVNVSAGGGLYDKGNNLSGKKIKLKKSLGLETWNLIGITGIDNMGNGFNNQSMDNKVNFLSNTANKNDFAAVDYDYTTNNWSSSYLKAKDDLAYGKGIFVWPFNTTHPNAASGDWDYTTTTNKAPELYQTGSCSIYTTTGMTAFNKKISDYVKTCKYNNPFPNATTNNDGGLWYCFANPFTADMSVKSLLNEIGYTDNNNTLIQGWCVYAYRISALGEGSWERLTANDKVKAGEGFMVPSKDVNGIYASTSADNSTADMMKAFSDKSLYGYNYVPWDAQNTSGAKSVRKEAPLPMTFLCADESRISKKITATFNEDTHNNFDEDDAVYMKSTSENHTVEPYFIVPDKQSKIKTLCHDSFSTLPYSVFLGFNSTKEQEVTFALLGNNQDIDVYLLDGENDTVICKFNEFHHIYDIDENGDTTITLTTANIAHIPVMAGNNEYKYKVLFTKGSVSLQDNPEQQEADINIWNNNREITINGKDLKHVEVFNALGQKVYESKIAGNIFQFNLNTIQGAYIIKAYNEQKLSKTAKIIIAK